MTKGNKIALGIAAGVILIFTIAVMVANQEVERLEREARWKQAAEAEKRGDLDGWMRRQQMRKIINGD